MSSETAAAVERLEASQSQVTELAKELFVKGHKDSSVHYLMVHSTHEDTGTQD